ncbi:hypothetical protein [Vreelandella nanhaiensis]|uniref:hypothetical protein n=1 Tax=Vreelandella nanhaiensis TaxID=1258546 RepID=UPI00163BDF8E|nr:hypothetical protein [Halomonas nanhaiensis]
MSYPQAFAPFHPTPAALASLLSRRAAAAGAPGGLPRATGMALRQKPVTQSGQ